MGNVEKSYDTRQYQFTLVTNSGKKVVVTAFGMDQITGPVGKLDVKVLSENCFLIMTQSRYSERQSMLMCYLVVIITVYIQNKKKLSVGTILVS
jgi:predicted nucleic acid-binding Zn ribbon protein